MNCIIETTPWGQCQRYYDERGVLVFSEYLDQSKGAEVSAGEFASCTLCCSTPSAHYLRGWRRFWEANLQRLRTAA